jgi:hypothetical protein
MSVGSFLARRGWWKLNIEGSSLGNPGRAGAGGPIRVATNMICSVHSLVIESDSTKAIRCISGGLS